MNKLLSGLMATALMGSFAMASVMPANAAPVYVPKSEQVRTDRTDVEKVNHTRRHWRIQQERRAFRAERRANRWERRREWRQDSYDHSAYRHHNRHWRNDNNGYWRDNNNGYWRDNGDNGGVTLQFNLGQ